MNAQNARTYFCTSHVNFIICIIQQYIFSIIKIKIQYRIYISKPSCCSFEDITLYNKIIPVATKSLYHFCSGCIIHCTELYESMELTCREIHEQIMCTSLRCVFVCARTCACVCVCVCASDACGCMCG